MFNFEVENGEIPSVKAETIEIGDAFEYSGYYYMRIKTVGSGTISVVGLSGPYTGSISYFSLFTPVKPCKSLSISLEV